MASTFSLGSVSRRRLLLSSASAALAAVLAACGPAASPTTAPTTAPAGGSTQAAAGATKPAAGAPGAKPAGEVRMWFPWEDRADFMVKEQAKAQPDVKLKFEVGEYDSSTKTMASLAAGNPPDFSFLGRWQTCDLAVRNGIFALDDRIKDARSWKWDDVWSRLQKDSTSWGKKWIVPYSTDTRALYYNKELMKQTGLDPEKPPKVWNDLVEQAAKGTKKDSSGKIDVIGYTPTFGNPPTFLTFYSMLWMFGSDIANEERSKVTLQEKGTQAMTLVKELMDKQGGYEQASAFTKALTLGQGLDAFSAGKVVLAMHTNGVLANYDKYAPNLQYGLAPGVTYPPNTEPFNYDGGGGLFYFKKAKNPDGAWAVTDFLMGKEFYFTWFDQLSFLPALRTVAEDWAKKDKRREVFASTANTVHWIPITVGALEAVNHVSKMWDDILLGKTPMDQALKTAADNIQQVLDKHNSYPPPQG
ncbi:MAG TPA: extracellular solute-binding protein [Chloroflexota bacterium]|jgi:ABC-type glycerol-3-phosphate transport system substrate-binding protein|nr:extracellular solute-binding protein [Chloroflexota bacterium]